MEWKYTPDNPLRVVTLCSGYDSQLMAIRNLGIPYECIGWSEIDPYAIRAHNGEMNGTAVETLFDRALRCGETVTGLVTAAALVRPTGIEGMEVKSLKKKLKDKAFAAGVNRDVVKSCTDMGLSLEEFLGLAVAAMARDAQSLGLLKRP